MKSTGIQIANLATHAFIDDVECVSVSCTQSSSLALSRKGELFAWGYNGNGQLGIGSYINKNTPQKVHSPAALFKQVTSWLHEHTRIYIHGHNLSLI